MQERKKQEPHYFPDWLKNDLIKKYYIILIYILYVYDHYKDEITFSKTQVQDINSTDCGYYCLYFLWYMINNKDNYEKFLTVFDKKDLEKNDATLLTKLNNIIK